MQLKPNALLISLLIIGFASCTTDTETHEETKKVPYADSDCKLDQVKLTSSIDTFDFDAAYDGNYTRVVKSSETMHKTKALGNDAATAIRFVYQPEKKLFLVYNGDKVVRKHQVLLAKNESRSELDRIACEYSIKSQRTEIKGADGFEFDYLKNANGLHLNTPENAPFRFSYIQDKKTAYSNIVKYTPGPKVEVVAE